MLHAVWVITVQDRPVYNANDLQPVSGSARATHMGSTEGGATECAGRWFGDNDTPVMTMLLANTRIELPP